LSYFFPFVSLFYRWYFDGFKVREKRSNIYSFLNDSEHSTSLLKDINLYVIFGITLTSILGVASIAPAFPAISRALDVPPGQIGYVITVFTIPGIFFTPVLGVMADRFGRKRILIPALFIFGIAGTACAFADTFGQLLLFRFLQGFGSAALGVLNVTLIGDLYEKNRRATAMGYNAGVLSVGTALYPAIGGALTVLGWNYPFFLTLLGIPVGIFAILFLKTSKIKQTGSLGIYFREIAAALKSRYILGLFAAMFFTFIILYGGYITYFVILLDERFGKSAFVIGVIVSGSSIITGIVSSQLGRLTLLVKERNLVIIASILYLAIFIMIPFVQNIWGFAIPIILFGVAQGINIPNIMNMITSYAVKDYRAAFLSVNWVIMKLGQALGPWLLGIVYLYYGIDGTFYVTAIIAALFVLVAVLFIRSEVSE